MPSFKAKFAQLSDLVTQVTGTWQVTLLAFLLVILWFIGGFIWGFSESYQMIINTGTTIVTFLMVFLIQASQNRDARAFHLKIAELIRATEGARNRLINLEKHSPEEMKEVEKEMRALED